MTNTNIMLMTLAGIARATNADRTVDATIGDRSPAHGDEPVAMAVVSAPGLPDMRLILAPMNYPIVIERASAMARAAQEAVDMDRYGFVGNASDD